MNEGAQMLRLIVRRRAEMTQIRVHSAEDRRRENTGYEERRNKGTTRGRGTQKGKETGSQTVRSHLRSRNGTRTGDEGSLPRRHDHDRGPHVNPSAVCPQRSPRLKNPDPGPGKRRHGDPFVHTRTRSIETAAK